MCFLIKRLGQAFVSKHVVKPLKRSGELLKHSPNIWGFKRKLKAWPSVWKARPRVCVITRPILSQSATISMGLWDKNTAEHWQGNIFVKIACDFFLDSIVDIQLGSKCVSMFAWNVIYYNSKHFCNGNIMLQIQMFAKTLCELFYVVSKRFRPKSAENYQPRPQSNFKNPSFSLSSYSEKMCWGRGWKVINQLLQLIVTFIKYYVMLFLLKHKQGKPVALSFCDCKAKCRLLSVTH